MKISILTRNENSSPRILAESLLNQLTVTGIRTELIFGLDFLNRLVAYPDSGLSRHFWLKRKLSCLRKDRKLLKQLKKADAIVVSECIPNAFWKGLYNIERLRQITGKPVFIYEVYALANAPTQIKQLEAKSDPLFSRYDGHLFVSPVTERRLQGLLPDTFCIGLFAKKWGLEPRPKKELLAIVDFVQPGYESYREVQVRALKKAGISYISLETRYTIAEIREIYSSASIFFLQFPEAFGVPVLECLCAGAQIFTPDSSWPMSWRLDEKPAVHGKGRLPGCFTVYENEDDLLQKLLLFKTAFDPNTTPVGITKEFMEYYSSFYNGDQKELDRFLSFVDEKRHRD